MDDIKFAEDFEGKDCPITPPEAEVPPSTTTLQPTTVTTAGPTEPPDREFRCILMLVCDLEWFKWSMFTVMFHFHIVRQC